MGPAPSTPSGWAVAACLLVLVLGSAAAGAAPSARGRRATHDVRGAPAVIGGTAPADSASGPTVRAHFVYSLDPEPGVVTVRVTYRVPSNVVSLRVWRPSWMGDRENVTGTTGFAAAPNGTWEWQRQSSGTASPSVTMHYAVNVSNQVFGGYDFVDAGSWALIEHAALQVRWRYRGTAPRYARNDTVATGDPGYVTPTMIYLGPYEARSATHNGQRFTLVVPAAAGPSNASAIFDSLGTASRWLDVGGKNPHDVVFRGPPPLRRGGLETTPPRGLNATGTDSIWVGSASGPNAVTYIGEYVHTRQSFDQTQPMSWIVEAQDSYYSKLLGLYRGTISYRTFYAAVSTADQSHVVLAPSNRTALVRRVDYSKGARVLAALDAKIRRATGRNRTLEDVWRRMNAHDGPLSYPAFRRIVDRVAGRSLDRWLDTYLKTSAVPPVPDNATLFAPTRPGIDSDGDGLVTAAELRNGTDPFVADTDHDGVTDGRELARGTNPLEPNTPTPTTTAETRSVTATTTATTVTTARTTRTNGSRAAPSGTAPRSGSNRTPGLLASLLILGLAGGAVVGFLGAVAATLARLLDRLVGVAPGFLARRSIVRLAGLSVASAALLVAYVAVFR